MLQQEHVPPGAKRHCTPCLYRYRLAGLPLPPSATCSYYPLYSQVYMSDLGEKFGARRGANNGTISPLSPQLAMIHSFPLNIFSPSPIEVLFLEKILMEPTLQSKQRFHHRTWDQNISTIDRVVPSLLLEFPIGVTGHKEF